MFDSYSWCLPITERSSWCSVSIYQEYAVSILCHSYYLPYVSGKKGDPDIFFAFWGTTSSGFLLLGFGIGTKGCAPY